MIALILAAGNGTRMKSSISKVLHKVNNQPMLLILINKLLCIKKIKKIIIVVGSNKDDIKKMLLNNLDLTIYNNLEFIEQKERLGTGHAVMVCKHYLSNYIEEKSLILFADVPLITKETLENMINNSVKNEVTLAICKTNTPTGSGRVILEKDFIIDSIEEKDCTEEQKKINLINTGIYIIQNKLIVNYIDFIDDNNTQKEYYLPDIMKILINNNYKINSFIISNNNEILNVNTQEQLAMANKIF